VLLLAMATAWAQTETATDPSEEIIIYADEFARWEDTRWLVATELLLPLGTPFGADKNESFMSYAFQIRAVVWCDKEGKLSKTKMEVACKIEDIALLVTTHRRWKREKDRELAERVLAEIDAKLTGAAVQMQVDKEGGVTNFDLEQVRADNLRERQIQEALRQVMTRVMSGFHLRIPDHAQRTGQWVEYKSELMDMPSLTASRGSTELVHVVSPYEGHQLVQTSGRGSVSVFIPTPAEDDPFDTVTQNTNPATASRSGGGGVGPQTLGGTEGAMEAAAEALLSQGGTESQVEITYEMSATGVALFERSTGIMTERVWACHGVPTAGSGVITGPPFRNVGRITLLGKDERPDVGPTKQVAPPGRVVEGLDPWVPLETMPE
jgi:hypothetical protein